jgi:hypothetical protein
MAPPASMASPSAMDRFIVISLLVFRKIEKPAASSALERAKKMRMHLCDEAPPLPVRSLS